LSEVTYDILPHPRWPWHRTTKKEGRKIHQPARGLASEEKVRILRKPGGKTKPSVRNLKPFQITQRNGNGGRSDCTQHSAFLRGRSSTRGTAMNEPKKTGENEKQ